MEKKVKPKSKVSNLGSVGWDTLVMCFYKSLTTGTGITSTHVKKKSGHNGLHL